MASIIKIDGKWRAQVRRKGHKTQTRTFETKVLAQRWAREIEGTIDKGEFRDQRDLKTLTVRDLIIRYKLETKRTIGRSKAGSLRQLETGLGDELLETLSADKLVQYAIARNVSSTTWLMEFTYFGKIWRIARSAWKLPVAGDPIKEARTSLELLGHITEKNERDRRPTTDELNALRHYFRHQARSKVPMADLVDFAIATAMRAGEIIALLWSDFDEAARTILIRDRKDPRRKSGNHQLVPLLPDAMTIIQRQPRVDDRIFPWADGTVSSLFPRACNSLGIIDLRFHDLRHEGTSRLFEMGYDIPEVAIFTGHKTWAQLKRYTQIKPAGLHRDLSVRRPWEPLPNVSVAAIRADARQSIADAVAAVTELARRSGNFFEAQEYRSAADQLRLLLNLHSSLLEPMSVAQEGPTTSVVPLLSSHLG